MLCRCSVIGASAAIVQLKLGKIMKKKYVYTNQKELRKAFKEMIVEFEGLEAWNTMPITTKRCAFGDWTDSLQKNGDISEALRLRAYWK